MASNNLQKSTPTTGESSCSVNDLRSTEQRPRQVPAVSAEENPLDSPSQTYKSTYPSLKEAAEKRWTKARQKLRYELRNQKPPIAEADRGTGTANNSLQNKEEPSVSVNEHVQASTSSSPLIPVTDDPSSILNSQYSTDFAKSAIESRAASTTAGNINISIPNKEEKSVPVDSDVELVSSSSSSSVAADDPDVALNTHCSLDLAASAMESGMHPQQPESTFAGKNQQIQTIQQTEVSSHTSNSLRQLNIAPANQEPTQSPDNRSALPVSSANRSASPPIKFPWTNVTLYSGNTFTSCLDPNHILTFGSLDAVAVKYGVELHNIQAGKWDPPSSSNTRNIPSAGPASTSDRASNVTSSSTVTEAHQSGILGPDPSSLNIPFPEDPLPANLQPAFPPTQLPSNNVPPSEENIISPGSLINDPTLGSNINPACAGCCMDSPSTEKGLRENLAVSGEGIPPDFPESTFASLIVASEKRWTKAGQMLRYERRNQKPSIVQADTVTSRAKDRIQNKEPSVIVDDDVQAFTSSSPSTPVTDDPNSVLKSQCSADFAASTIESGSTITAGSKDSIIDPNNKEKTVSVDANVKLVFSSSSAAADDPNAALNFQYIADIAASAMESEMHPQQSEPTFATEHQQIQIVQQTETPSAHTNNSLRQINIGPANQEPTQSLNNRSALPLSPAHIWSPGSSSRGIATSNSTLTDDERGILARAGSSSAFPFPQEPLSAANQPRMSPTQFPSDCVNPSAKYSFNPGSNIDHTPISNPAVTPQPGMQLQDLLAIWNSPSPSNARNIWSLTPSELEVLNNRGGVLKSRFVALYPFPLEPLRNLGLCPHQMTDISEASGSGTRRNPREVPQASTPLQDSMDYADRPLSHTILDFLETDSSTSSTKWTRR